jgi:hypothetical protein
VLTLASGAALAEKNQLVERVAVTVRWQMAFFYLGAAFWKVNTLLIILIRYLHITFHSFVTYTLLIILSLLIRYLHVTYHSFLVILIYDVLYRICY